MHPLERNPRFGSSGTTGATGRMQEIRSELVCPWTCTSGYSDDPEMCQYNQDCSGCGTVSFNAIDSACPDSLYGCCADRKTEKTDKFGNNCLTTGATGTIGISGNTFDYETGDYYYRETFTSETIISEETKENQNIILKIPIKQKLCPACPNINYPNSSAFSEDTQHTPPTTTTLETLPPYPWSVVSEYK